MFDNLVALVFDCRSFGFVCFCNKLQRISFPAQSASLESCEPIYIYTPARLISATETVGPSVNHPIFRTLFFSFGEGKNNNVCESEDTNANEIVKYVQHLKLLLSIEDKFIFLLISRPIIITTISCNNIIITTNSCSNIIITTSLTNKTCSGKIELQIPTTVDADYVHTLLTMYFFSVVLKFHYYFCATISIFSYIHEIKLTPLPPGSSSILLPLYIFSSTIDFIK